MGDQEIFQAFSALSDAQTVIELGGDADEINHQIGHAKHHLFKLMDGWDRDQSMKAMMIILVDECGISPGSQNQFHKAYRDAFSPSARFFFFFDFFRSRLLSFLWCFYAA